MTDTALQRSPLTGRLPLKETTMFARWRKRLRAAKQDVPDPDKLTFKDKDEYTIIGRSVSGVDNLVIATGAALVFLEENFSLHHD